MMSPADVIALSPWLAHLETHLQIARDGVDPEGVHQVRVATRRLAVWLELSGRSVLLSDLAWLRARAGAVRDLDVMLARAGVPRPFARWLAEQRTAARRQLLDALAEPRLTGLLEALSLLPAMDADRAERNLTTIAEDVLAAASELEESPEEIDALHRLRRRMRRLRYALDWLQRPIEPFRGVQEVFGKVNDLSNALELLAAFPGAARLDSLRASWTTEIARNRRKARRLWRRTSHHVEAIR
jgi:CHAD domain-containing protein